MTLDSQVVDRAACGGWERRAASGRSCRTAAAAGDGATAAITATGHARDSCLLVYYPTRRPAHLLTLLTLLGISLNSEQ